MTHVEINNGPFQTLESWRKVADSNHDPVDAFCLSTVGSDGEPHGRMLLLKYRDQRLRFFTHKTSPKLKQIGFQSMASMTFYYPTSGLQIRVNGHVHDLEREESDQYWQSRQRESQLASYCSKQSEVLAHRDIYLNSIKEAEMQFNGRTIPLPDHWGGYELVPEKFEFFRYGEYRMNFRTVFKKTGNEWSRIELFP